MVNESAMDIRRLFSTPHPLRTVEIKNVLEFLKPK